MKKRMLRLLLELMKDSKRSDRELAKILDMSQPTISRMRSRLVKEGIIREFTVIPDFTKMGYDIMAITCTKMKMKQEFIEKRKKWTKEHTNVILSARTEGMGKNGVIISLHKNYADFAHFIERHLWKWGDEIEDYCTMLISLKESIVKPFSLKYLAEHKET